MDSFDFGYLGSVTISSVTLSFITKDYGNCLGFLAGYVVASFMLKGIEYAYKNRKR